MNEESRYRLGLLAFCVPLFTFALGSRDLWAPDEARYAVVARNILESGDWQVLTENGRPYTQKPPLYFWILAATARLGTGVNELTSRVPSSIFALLTVFLAFELGRNLFGSRVGLFGSLFLATSQRFFLEGRWVHIDMLLTLTVMAALFSAWQGLATRKKGWWAAVWVATGLGCLAKGPVALAIPAVAVLTYLASSREMRRLKETGWMVGIPGTLLPTLAWLFASCRRTGVDPGEILRLQILERFSQGVHHPRPFYYYLYSLPLEFLPWSIFLPSLVRVTHPTPETPRRRPLLFLYAWFLGGLVLLSLSAEKRPSYLLPLFPALALLLGVLWDTYLVRSDPGAFRKWIEVPVWIGAAACLAALLYLPLKARDYPGLSPRLVALCAILLAGFTVAATAIRSGRRGVALLSLLGGAGAGYLWIAGSLLPWLDTHKSARPFSERIAVRIGAAPLGIYGDFHPGFGFYTRRRLKVLGTPGELEGFLGSTPGASCLMQEKDWNLLRSRVHLRELDREGVGHRSYVLAERAPGTAAGP